MTYELAETDTTTPTSHILLHVGDDVPLLSVTKDGFYVRGVKVDADEDEANKVYAAFKEWLIWANLTRD